MTSEVGDTLVLSIGETVPSFLIGLDTTCFPFVAVVTFDATIDCRGLAALEASDEVAEAVVDTADVDFRACKGLPAAAPMVAALGFVAREELVVELPTVGGVILLLAVGWVVAELPGSILIVPDAETVDTESLDLTLAMLARRGGMLSATAVNELEIRSGISGVRLL